MGKIKQLPEEESQKIAAGEVVERPANIVKETIENSIDAQATKISLYIEEAGKKLIRIIDNGIGMDKEDAKLCFQPYATSKIQKIEDLCTIQSFGFRGEALASISAVSKIILLTKQEDQATGTLLEKEGNKIIKISPATCATGTDLQIKNLFFNLPVRKKFLKQEETEWNQILSIFQAFCLSNLSIHFELFKNGKNVYNLPAVHTLKERTQQLWGNEFANQLLEITPPLTKPTKLEIKGMISNHNFSRYGRQQIFFFVNNRWVKNSNLSKALLKGYLDVLPPAKFPAAFLFINISPEEIDINIHPRKEEIKFMHPRTIEIEIQKIVQQTLQNFLKQQLSSSQQKEKDYSLHQEFWQSQTVSQTPNNSYEINFSLDQPFASKNIHHNSKHSNQPLLHEKKESFFQSQTIEYLPGKQNNNEKIEDNAKIEVTKQTPKIIGQLFQTYIIVEKKNNLVIIDQHAAHERIIYEKILKNFEKKEGIKLLFPETVSLTPYKIKLLLKTTNFLYKQGISIDQFSENKIVIKTAPPKIQNQALKEFILELVQFLEENEKVEEEIFRKKLNEHIHGQLACKMAVKAGDILSFEEMGKIIHDLQKTEKPLICVHGRPTTWIISKQELEKKFKRR